MHNPHRSLEDSGAQLRTFGWLDVLRVQLPKHRARVAVPASMLQSLQWRVAAHDMDAVTAMLSGVLLVCAGWWWVPCCARVCVCVCVAGLPWEVVAAVSCTCVCVFGGAQLPIVLQADTT